MEVWGLILNTIGAVILAIAQNQLDGTVRVWLMALDFSVETIATPGRAPILRFTGMEDQMNRTLRTNRWLSTVAWIVIATGFMLQLIPHVHSQ